MNIILPDCGAIPAPFNGAVSFTNNRTTYHEVATFTCDIGYYLSHVQTRTCEAAGEWMGSTPDCIVKGKTPYILNIKYTY